MEMPLLSFLIIVITLFTKARGQCSSFNYIVQPQIPLDCNPFTSDPVPVWTLRTQCSVESSVVNDFEIHWIHRNTSGDIEDLGVSSSSATSASRYDSFFDQFEGTPFNEGMLGQYWCEVYVNGQSAGAYSDGFTILRREEYDSQLAACSGIRADVNVNICRDSPPASPAAPTSEPALPPAPTTSEPALPPAPMTSEPAPPPAPTTSESALPPAPMTSEPALPPAPTTSEPALPPAPTTSEPAPPPAPTTSEPALPPAPTTSEPALPPALPSATTMNMIPAISTSTIDPVESSSITQAINTTSTTSISQTNFLPEERLNENDDMSYLLVTAIALIVILSVIIVLLLVIACLMKCGRRKPITQAYITRGKRRRNKNLFRLSSIRSSRAELLGQTTESPFHTEYVPVSQNIGQDYRHEYFTIDEDTLPKVSKRRERENQYNISNLPKLKPPSIIRTKSLTNRCDVTDISNESIDVVDNSGSNKLTNADTNSQGKVEKLSNTEKGSGQLENWDYQWNPMYMKIPVGLRVINTL